jgi:catechol 2,3-dioxygenase-like lactoylglutathione lyase family enzyme
MIKNIRHIGITVSNVEKAIELYRDIFGLEIVWDQIEHGKFIDRLSDIDNIRVRTIKLKDSTGSMIELLHYLSHPEDPKNDQITRIGCSHIAITVENINEMYNKLLNFGLKFNYEPQTSVDGNAKVAFCRDYDGTLIEVVQEVK